MLNSQVPVQLFQIDDSSPSAVLFGDNKKEAVKTSLVVTLLFSATDCAPPAPVFPAAPQTVGAAVEGGLKGGGVLTLVDNPRLFVLSNLSRKFLSNKLDDISTSLLLAGLTPAVLF